MNKRVVILRFISDYRKQHGYPPSVREIGDALQIASTGMVHYWLDVLVKEHLLYRTPGVARGLRISMQGRAYLGEPVQAKGA